MLIDEPIEDVRARRTRRAQYRYNGPLGATERPRERGARRRDGPPSGIGVTWEGWFTLAIIGFVFYTMVRGLAPTDLALWGGAVLLTLVGIIDARELLSGLAEPAVATVGALFVISAAMRETGALDMLGKHLLGRAETERGALLRMIPQVAGFSAFLNNTAVVAMFVPVVTDWCRRARISPSRFLMPLSFLSILGGMCTLIGTSTNIIVSDLMNAERLAPLGMFELAWIGVPCVIIGAAYLLTLGARLLPDRRDLIEQFGQSTREYTANLTVTPNCPLVGKTVEEAGLRRLPGLFLIEIDRATRIIAPVEPDQMILAGDRLTFAGVVSTIFELERIPGLMHEVDMKETPSEAERRRRRYCEAVISSTSPLIGKTIRESNFRALYNAVVVAVHRGGVRLAGRIGDIRLAAGDTLLLQSGPHFVEANRNNPDFFLVSSVEEARPVRHERAWIALTLLGVLVILLAFGKSAWLQGLLGHDLRPEVAALLIGGALILFRCISPGDARRAISLDVLFTIAAAFGLGIALKKSGAAGAIAQQVVVLTEPWGRHAVLAAVYGLTMALHMMVTSNATAVLMFPLAMGVAAEMGVDPRPFAIAIASASAAGFATPMSYQTNMMVYGPGGYRFNDFLRVGLPLHLLLWVLAVVLVPMIWPFTPAI
ncbi:MAG: SLC13 family permease [Planctomycetota bacterium]|nr:MAG: SLC13 family permease [Planctomycetota bacterium]